MVEIRACGWNRQRFVVVINPRLTGYALNRGAPSVSLSELLRYKNPYNSRNEATGREENFAFFRCSFYTVTRDYPQKLVALKIIAAAGKYPDSCIAVSLCSWFLCHCIVGRTGF